PRSDYPLTERIVAAGSGSYLVEASTPRPGDESERELLAELGYQTVLGVTARGAHRVWLLELYELGDNDSLRGLSSLTRLAAAAATAPHADRFAGGRERSGLLTPAELSLSIARRLDEAE